MKEGRGGHGRLPRDALLASRRPVTIPRIPRGGLLPPRKQSAPRATQRPMNADHRRQENVELSSLDLLDCPQIQVRQFCKAFLR